MKAAVVRSFTEPLVVEERPVPTPAGHQVLARMETSGLCHTDIHAAQGDWPVKPSPPFAPGHEGIGIVEAAGEQVTHLAVGDRVAIPWLGEARGHCDYCISGWETLCLKQQNSGYSVDGSHAEYALAHGTYVVPVPAGIDPLDAAPLTCAVLIAGLLRLEVEVFDCDRLPPARFRPVQQPRQGMADLGVSVAGRAAEAVGEVAGPADRVAAEIEAPGGEVVGVGVHTDHTVRQCCFDGDGLTGG
ncbi:hypothetical protein GCM10010207_69510 [Streptomyces atratus]|nr:hypothetical protein GCM10010207_69510 [Streptomyces atratus]